MGSAARAQDARPPNASTGFDLAGAIASGASMTSDLAAERAAAHSPAVERAAALTRAAEIAVLRTRDQLLPRLDLGARYAHVDGFPNGSISLVSDPAALAQARALADQIADPASRILWQQNLAQPNKIIAIPRNQVGLSARISWPVSDLFLQIAPAIDAAEAGARGSEAQRKARLARVRLSARESFYQLARARGTLAVTTRAVEQAKSQQERIDSAVRAGLRAPADGSSAAARVASAEQMQAAAAAGADVADAALRTLLDDKEGTPYGIAEPIFERDLTFDSAPPAQLLERARAQRPEVFALRQSIEAQRHSVRAAQGSAYPHVAIYAGADYAMPNRYVIPPKAEFQPSWEVGATLSYAPNDTLSASRRDREGNAQMDALKADLAELERALTLEIRQAYAALASAQRTVESARAAEKAALDAYEQRLAELHAGEVTTADLFAAESELNRARLDALDATIDQLLARARLSYAIGE